jgi:hypothetical protein
LNLFIRHLLYFGFYIGRAGKTAFTYPIEL